MPPHEPGIHLSAPIVTNHGILGLALKTRFDLCFNQKEPQDPRLYHLLQLLIQPLFHLVERLRQLLFLRQCHRLQELLDLRLSIIVGLDLGPNLEVGPDLVRMREVVDSDHSLLMEQVVAETMAEAAAMDMVKDMAMAEPGAEDTKQEEEEVKLREVPFPPSVELCFVHLPSAVGEPTHWIP